MAHAKKRIRSSLIIGKAEPVKPPVAGAAPQRSAASGRAAPSGFLEPTSPAPTVLAIFGAVLVVAAVTLLVLQFTLPWIKVGLPAGASETWDRGETIDQLFTNDFDQRLTLWPLLSYILLIVAGTGLVALDVLPNVVGVQRILQSILLAFSGYLGFLTALTGFRWLGFYFTQLANDQIITYHLHAVPYLNLAAGLGVVAGSLALLRDRLRFFLDAPNRSRFGTAGLRVPAWTVAVVAVGLCALPLAPYAKADVVSPFLPSGFGDTLYLDETALETFRDAGRGDAADPGRDLGVLRAMLWVTLYLALLVFAFAVVERTGHFPMLWGTLTQLYALVLVPVIVGLVFAILLYVDIPQMGDATGSDVSLLFNPAPILNLAALGAVYAFYVLRVGAAYASTARAAGTAPSA